MKETKSREERIAELLSPSADDIIAAIVAFLPQVFSADYQTIHRAFATFKQKKEYQDILQDFEFVGTSPYPYSPLLERVLSRLQEDRLLSARNPDYQVYLTSDTSRTAIQQRIITKFSELQKRKLKKLAEELEKVLVE